MEHNQNGQAGREALLPSSHADDTRAPTRNALVPIDHQQRLVVSVAEAATLLDISRAFAYELVARGDLPVIRLGRRRLVPKVALYALLEAPACSIAT
jgi:excisionase family DNA binding protein